MAGSGESRACELNGTAFYLFLCQTKVWATERLVVDGGGWVLPGHQPGSLVEVRDFVDFVQKNLETG